MCSTRIPLTSPGNRTPQNSGFFIDTTCKTEVIIMSFFHSAIGVLQTLVIALGAGLAIWGAINLLEGYGNDNPGANAQGL